MRKLMFLLTAAALALAATPAQAGYHGTTVKLRAVLDARQVAPKQDVNVPSAAGLFTATLTGKRLTWTLTYRGLSGPALGAHIHLGKRGTAKWEPVVGLCGFLADNPLACKPGVRGTTMVHDGTLYPVSTAEIMKAILGGRAYVNIHTTDNYNWGELRGQIEVVK